jgi:hypothetical protein
MAVSAEFIVFYVVTPCSLVSDDHHFEEACCVNLQGEVPLTIRIFKDLPVK